MTKWVITKDIISDGDDVGVGNYKGNPKFLDTRFKLYDDDGELYYKGRMSTDGGDDIFDPLDWAMSNVGCTELQIFDKSFNRWVVV